MDALDVRIVRAMGLAPYAPVESTLDALKPGVIAKRVGVTAETVRERVQRLETAGIIEGYEAIPNLRHFGLDMGAFLFRPTTEANRERFHEAPDMVDGIVEITCFLGSAVCVDLAFASIEQRSRRLRMLAELSGDVPSPFYGWEFPPVSRSLTLLDWRILGVLRNQARRPLAEVADDLGISYRTVKRHHDRMAKERSFFVRPRLNPAKDPGLVTAGLCFTIGADAPADTAERIKAAFDDEFVFSGTAQAGPGLFGLMVFGPSAASIEEMRRRGAKLPGVEKVEALVLAEVHPYEHWIDELLDEKVKAMSRTAAADPVD